MVNIHIHQFRPGGAVVDAAALEQFQQQWATYQKLVDADELLPHPKEWAQIDHHVTTSDFPETQQVARSWPAGGICKRAPAV